MTDQTITGVLYLIDAWERGAYAEEYPNEIEALRQALAQPEQGCAECGVKASDGYALYCVACTDLFTQSEQEPVAWISDSPTKGNGKQLHFTKANAWKWSSNITPLYTAPPSKPWVSLTDEEIIKIVRERGWVQSYLNLTEIIEFTGTIEAALRSKNT